MEITEKFPEDAANAESMQGQLFGIVCKMDKSFRSHAQYGTLCEIQGQEQSNFVLPDQGTNVYSGNRNGFVQVKALGLRRFRIDRVVDRALDGLILTCEVTVFYEQGSTLDVKIAQTPQFKSLKDYALEYCKLSQQTQVTHRQQLYSQKEQQLAKIVDSATQLTFFVCQLVTTFMKEEFQAILNENDIEKRMLIVMSQIEKELVAKKQQRLKREQLFKQIGQSSSADTSSDEIQTLQTKIAGFNLPEEAKKIVEQEVKKLKQIGPRSQEYHVGMNYLQTISDLPWGINDEENMDPKVAQEVLDRDHYGLDLVKNRIIQFLAIRKLTKNNKGSIMCFHGPPGVGKTSLGKSIAEALGRKFYRLALGGVRDEAEIRGHRRTYVGAMPGVIINSLKKVKSSNPVFLLDEIDKMGRDARGDPGAALLEVLDPAQNNKFTDHFLATPFDLSDIMFIATANSLDTIHPALLDRMEVIEISGYSLEEKLEIAKKYIVPRQIKENGITDKVIQIKEKELKQIIIEYTAESGVRNLERAIGSVCRVVAYKYAIASDPETFKRVTVDSTLITDALGNNTSDVLLNERIQTPGTAIGLAYTANGGRALLIETTKYPGSGKLILTGQLGDVMKESIGTSLSWIRSNAVRLGLVPQLQKLQAAVVVNSEEERRQISNLMNTFDLHVHFPAAAVPKDGPSAGVTITVALVSLFTGRRVRSDFAMTGEISLQGIVMPVGGIKEKCMAAHRNKIKNVILPKLNEKDLVGIPVDLKRELKIHFVSNVVEAIMLALEGK